jgi:hypothetical protein
VKKTRLDKAFSSDVDTGSREENASKKKLRSPPADDTGFSFAAHRGAMPPDWERDESTGQG